MRFGCTGPGGAPNEQEPRTAPGLEAALQHHELALRLALGAELEAEHRVAVERESEASQSFGAGIPDRKADEWAMSGKGYWRVAGSWILTRSLTNAYWVEQDLEGFVVPYRRLRSC